MAGSGTYQVNVGPIRDIAAPFLAGTKTLSGALQGITDDQLNQDKLTQTQLEHADRMKQMELNRAERVSARGRARSDAAARRAELKAEKKAQRDAIKGALTSFNTDAPDSINTGLETQQAVNSTYDNSTNKYNELSGILDTEDNFNINTQATAQVYKNVRDEETAQLQSILGKTAIAKNEVMGKGDAIQYDGEGKVIPNAGMQAIDATQFGIEQRKQAVDNEYKTSMYDLLNPSDTAYNAVQGIADQQAEVATDNKGVIAEQQSALDTAFNKRIGDLNTGIQTDYANDPQVLDKVTNPNRVANELYQSLLMKDVDPAVAAKTAQAWLKANPVKTVDKALVTSLKDERTTLLDLMATETKKTETGKLAGSGTGNGGNSSSLSLKSGETPANAVYKYYKFGNIEGSLDNFASLGRNGLAKKETELRGKLPTGTKFSDKEIAQALVYGAEAAWPGGDSLTIDTGKSLEYLKKDKAGRTVSNQRLTSTLKRKSGTAEQNAKLRSIEQALNAARNPNLTPRKNLKNFSKAARTEPKLANALKVSKLPSKPKETVIQPKKATKPVQTKEPVSTKTVQPIKKATETKKPKLETALTKDSVQVDKPKPTKTDYTKVSETINKDPIYNSAAGKVSRFFTNEDELNQKLSSKSKAHIGSFINSNGGDSIDNVSKLMGEAPNDKTRLAIGSYYIDQATTGKYGKKIQADIKNYIKEEQTKGAKNIVVEGVTAAAGPILNILNKVRKVNKVKGLRKALNTFKRPGRLGRKERAATLIKKKARDLSLKEDTTRISSLLKPKAKNTISTTKKLQNRFELLRKTLKGKSGKYLKTKKDKNAHVEMMQIVSKLKNRGARTK